MALTVDAQSGAISSLKWKQNGAEFVDPSHGVGLGQYLYVPGTDSSKAQTLSHVHVRVKEQGSLVTSLLVEADAPGAKHYSTEIRLITGLNRLDLVTNIDKRSVRTKEGVHLAFPFAVPSGQLRYDVADSIVRPEIDQLAGSCKNFFSVQSWVDVSNRDYGVTWSAGNAPLIEIGAISAERPWMKTIEPSSSFYSYVMNNYWHTNYKADQEGLVTFSYSILPHGAFDPVEATKFGIERRQPLLVSTADSSTTPSNSFFRISSSDVLVLSVKPIAEHSFLLHLYNPSGEKQAVGFRPQTASAAIRVRLSDAAGTSGNQVPNLQIAAFDSAYVRLEMRARHEVREAARRVMHGSQVPYGFRKLAQMKRLDLTIEAIVHENPQLVAPADSTMGGHYPGAHNIQLDAHGYGHIIEGLKNPLTRHTQAPSGWR
jgi:hypothetical protein